MKKEIRKVKGERHDHAKWFGYFPGHGGTIIRMMIDLFPLFRYNAFESHNTILWLK